MEPVTFHCQMCRAKLNITGSMDGLGGEGRHAHLNASVFDGAKIDESFVVLNENRSAGMPPPTAAAGSSARPLDESFVVLGSASLLRPPRGCTPPPPQQRHPRAGAGAAPPSSSSPADAGEAPPQRPPTSGLGGGGGAAAGGGGTSTSAAAAGLDAKLQALAALFELASSRTQVDHPLCLDCAAQLKEEMDAQVADAEEEAAAYSAALVRAECQPAEALPQEAFEAQLAALAEQKAEAHAAAEALRAQLVGVEREAAALSALEADVEAAEEAHWHDLNDYQLQLMHHIGERDALLHRIDRASQRLQLLKATNVLSDAFKIWHDGPFGTISGFRLGRTADAPVSWEEVNAAWGQAVLLLHTLARSVRLSFSGFRLLPMGSHPRVADKRATYDLFGPVNKLWSASYDRAMVGYVACLRQFGDLARARDVAANRDRPFEFPFAIDGDKVGGYTVKLTLNKDARWTKALKLMLANLKVALQWTITSDAAGAEVRLPPLPALQQEGVTV